MAATSPQMYGTDAIFTANLFTAMTADSRLKFTIPTRMAAAASMTVAAIAIAKEKSNRRELANSIGIIGSASFSKIIQNTNQSPYLPHLGKGGSAHGFIRNNS